MSRIFDSLNTAVQRVFGEKADGETLAIEWVDHPERVASGIYDSRFYAQQAGEGAAVSSLITSLAVNDSETGEVEIDERLIVRGRQYRVKDTRPDGQGQTILELELDPDLES